MIKPKYLWYINAFLGLVALFLVYRIWLAPKSDAWNYIPDNAFLIVESSQIHHSLFSRDGIDSTQLADIPFFYDALQPLKLIGENVDTNTTAQKFLNKKLITYSLHRETKKNLEYIVYIPAGAFGDAEFLNQLLKPDLTKRKVYGRTYKGIRIEELYNVNNRLLFNFLIHDDYLICSGSKILLEEVVNRIRSGGALENSPFKETRRGIAHIYYKSKNLRDVADILPSQLSPNLIEFFSNITPRNPDVVFEKPVSPNTVSAYIYSKGTNTIPFLGIFGQQMPQPLTCTDLIPVNTSITFRLSFHNPAKLEKDLSNYFRANEQELLAEKDSLNRLLNVNLGGLYQVLKNELVLCEMETSTDEASRKILLIKTKDQAEAMNMFDDLAANAEKLSSYFKPKPFSYLNNYVRKIQISQLPALLFGSLFRGFPDCYYTQIGDYIVLASDDEAMREYLNNLNTGQTWARSGVYTDFVKKLRPQAQVTAIISPQRIWNNFYFSLPQKWRNSVVKHEQRAKSLRFIAFENFVINNTFGTKVLIEKIPQTQKEVLVNRFFMQDSLNMSARFKGKPFVINNAASASEEIMLQQEDNQVVLVSSSATEVNKVPLGQAITSPYLLPTDYFQNGTLHYLATTPGQLVFFSRENQKGLVANYADIQFKGEIKAVTSSETKIYVADEGGNIYIINEETQRISRLNTLANLYDIVQIQAVKYKNNTYLAVLQKDGTLTVFYEQGPILSGFPKVPMSSRPLEMIVEEGPSRQSLITLVSVTGEIIKVDMTGNSLSGSGIQLERPNKATVFEVIFDQNHKDWLIARRTPTSLMISNKQGNPVLEIGSTNFMQSQLRYFDLGNDLRFIAIFDGKNNTLFNLKGQMLGDKPLPGSALPALSYSEAYNKLFIYNTNKTRFEVWTVKLK
ncbi:hypothetical protein [Emticicia sp. 21SJ11W-3]|uniref:hypothetical protein n=1 Tax=Emticicia sp. 21SJ11W-3 TaxID=2916755 RepID=UPI00209D1316|nr:hypothetical protein [Emticicia sp. 21SJ11W-3]UTA68952.1 hypothetical protein MB380_03900 [Emticicia sp. 21SJ11W-3]